MNGHWDAPLEVANASDGGVADGDNASDVHISTEYVNLGIAVVTPIDKVLSMLEQSPLSDIIAERQRTTEEGLKALDSEHPSTPDS
jgi:hypothetical protein